MPRIRLDSSISPTWTCFADAADRDGFTFAGDGAAVERHWADMNAGRPNTLRSTLDAIERAAFDRRYVGYLGYDLGRFFEQLSPPAMSLLPVVAFYPCGTAAPPPLPSAGDVTAGVPRSNFNANAYRRAVRQCIDYITAGDVFQINLAQQLAVPTAALPHDIYARLRAFTPGTYDALLEFDHGGIVSNSPELFLKIERLPDGRRRIINRPIKGTRPAGPGMRDELERSAKDRAELAMIVDLQRNDLGRICRTGTVRVVSPRQIETHATVIHGVATIEGILRDDITLYDVLRATFPCGSITGCPKIRAMQIIDELEPSGRGVYCGAIGWIENGELELSVAIRTMTLASGIATVPVGGGIVADSDPQAEYDETLTKARALLMALGAS